MEALAAIVRAGAASYRARRFVMRSVMLSAVLVLAAGCMHDPAEAPEAGAPAEHGCSEAFVLRVVGSQPIAVRVGEAEIVGPEVALALYEDDARWALRGRAFDRPVDLELTSSEVAGSVGGLPLRVVVTREGEGLHVRGLVRGQISEFRLDGQTLSGRVGRCSYDLDRSGRTYEGRRSCAGASIQIVSLQLPASLARWNAPEMAASISVLLGG
jgi:hypothetical protein